MSASEARRRLELFRKKQQAAAAAKQQQQQQQAGSTAGGATAGSSDTEAAAAAAAASVSFEGAISEAFGDSLKYYVAEEQKEVSRISLDGPAWCLLSGVSCLLSSLNIAVDSSLNCSQPCEAPQGATKVRVECEVNTSWQSS